LLPLHASQKEIRCSEGFSIFEYFIAPTFDFIQELRTHGTDILVLEPKTLVGIFREEARKAFKMYCK
jgi:predicted DNA-binding transcriptional regulator YafY